MKLVSVPVPKALLTDCVVPEPVFSEKPTNAEYEEWVDNVYLSLIECASSKRYIRQYLEAMQEQITSN